METTSLPATGRAPTSPGERSAPTFDCVPLPVVQVEESAYIVTQVNPAFCQLLGKSREELVGVPFASIVPDGAAGQSTLDYVHRSREPFPPVHENQADPPPDHWLYALWPARHADDHPVGVIIQLTPNASFQRDARAVTEALLISGLHQHELTTTAVDLNTLLGQEISERKLTEVALQAANVRLADQAGELERLVAERTEKLRETVADLEAFSYSVAHDLRAPLRSMQGFARILLKDHAGGLDVTAHNYLERIARSAARMDLLIMDVLNYTRVLRSEALLVPVDLDKLVRDIITTYPDWQLPQAIIQIDGTLPRVLGHEGFLTQCVSNILSNAVKFVAPGVTPRVRIRAETRSASVPPPAANGNPPTRSEPEEPYVRVWFADNGIGIAPRDRDRVFRMLERINPADKFEGTGIGLTIVRKALQRLGGQVDFESVPGQGSRFWIELKAAPPMAAPTPSSR